ncbi:MAG: hypothetical protein ACLUHA_12845 [Bacteroides stercoris]
MTSIRLDFEALAEDKRPIVIVVLRDVSSGRILIPSKLVFKYNGTELAFGEDGLCTTEQFVGTFKRVTGYNVSVDSQSYPMTGLRVMKNLVPISGYDNDRITVSGEVEIGGHTVAFNELDDGCCYPGIIRVNSMSYSSLQTRVRR